MDVNMESMVEEKPELVVSSYSSNDDNNFGEPEILPRVGDQYQVDIPPLMIGQDDLAKQTNSIFKSGNEDASVKESENSGYKECGYFLICDSSCETWSEIEYDSFLLCLYIFGKNFNLVKKFVELNEMGDILGFYYGRFYRSDKYVRWSEGQKKRSKRIVYRQKIFTGWRLQELLLRLSSLVSLECYNKLTEISGAYGDGKLSLEDFVFALKDIVGIDKFVSAVAIGKGKKDLTGVDPKMSPEIPNGKSWSSLTSSNIIKLLTKDFCLSKAKLRNLFWEAVWPRLLARGWQSEQPRDRIYADFKNSLVFLVPGIQKFSRRKLTKGSEYFDSVTDVLKKVALEPELIELEFDEGKGGSMSDPQAYNDPGNSKERRHCYLQPRNSSFDHNLMKFTVVDTSLVKMRELRSLPADPINLSSLSSEEPQGELEENNSSSLLKKEIKNNQSVDSTESMPRSSQDATIQLVKNHKDQSSSVSGDRSSSSVKFKRQRKVKSLKSNCLVPVKKKCELSEYVQEESRHHVENVSADAKLKKEESFASSKVPCEKIGSPDRNLNGDLTGTHSSFSCGAGGEQNGVNGRRQSTRNSLLSTRALEALECESLVTTKKRGKGNTEAMIYSRHVRAKTAADTECVQPKADVDAAKMVV